MTRGEPRNRQTPAFGRCAMEGPREQRTPTEKALGGFSPNEETQRSRSVRSCANYGIYIHQYQIIRHFWHRINAKPPSLVSRLCGPPGGASQRQPPTLDSIADLIGSVDGAGRLQRRCAHGPSRGLPRSHDRDIGHLFVNSRSAATRFGTATGHILQRI